MNNSHVHFENWSLDGKYFCQAMMSLIKTLATRLIVRWQRNGFSYSINATVNCRTICVHVPVMVCRHCAM